VKVAVKVTKPPKKMILNDQRGDVEDRRLESVLVKPDRPAVFLYKFSDPVDDITQSHTMAVYSATMCLERGFLEALLPSWRILRFCSIG